MKGSIWMLWVFRTIVFLIVCTTRTCVVSKVTQQQSVFVPNLNKYIHSYLHDNLNDPNVMTTFIRHKRDFDFFGFDPSPLTSNSKEAGYAKLDWKHCGNKNDVIILNNIQLSPNPIQVPGKILIGFNMDVKENQTAPIKLRVDMKKKIPMLFGIHTWMPVPCYPNGVGSCIIEDICNYKKINFGQSCPKQLLEQNITCKCPLIQGNYSVPPIEQDVPRPPTDIDPILMEGEFRIKFSLYKEHKRLTCYETNAIIKL